MSYKILFFSFFFAIITLLGCKQEKVEPLQVLQADNQEIPVYDLEGLQQYLHVNDDKIQVVNFWATWCGPCVKEIPHFEQVQKDMEQEVDVTLVSLDFENQLESSLIPFVNKKNLKSNVIVVLAENESEMMETVSPNWQSGIPATLIYSKNKRYFVEGALSHEELLKQIKKIKS